MSLKCIKTWKVNLKAIICAVKKEDLETEKIAV